MIDEQLARDVLSGKSRGIAASALRLVLLVLEPFYALVVWIRNKLFDWQVRKPGKLARPVVSVGNITTGGTGKTPMVMHLASLLRQAGFRPAILTRGYRAAAETPADEARLLESVAPVFAGSNRLACGTGALQADPSIDCFLLDDGFQHRQLHRDLDIVLIDGTNPFGFDHVLPRGLLREPLGGLSRADVIVITRFDQSDEAARSHIQRTLARFNPRAPVLRCSHALANADRFRGKPVVAFCGIGNPDAFFESLRRAGAMLVETRAFADHHPYTAADIGALDHPDAELLVTTAKDHVRLPATAKPRLPLEVAGMELRFEPGDGERMIELVTRLLPGR
jgi:tetraacyldisaccharide 4'-kinase